MSKFGWYSAKAAKICKLHIYLTPTGEKLGVTRVSDSMDSRSGWDDERCIGLVDKYVRSYEVPHVCSYEATNYFSGWSLQPPRLTISQQQTAADWVRNNLEWLRSGKPK